MIDDDPLLSALAHLPSPPLSESRADRVRIHVRELVQPMTPSVTRRATRVVAPYALAAFAMTYLTWTVRRIADTAPGRVLRAATMGSSDERPD